ncbi:rhomboid family intramembrane serine protease [Halobellus limi]|jgi:membrane associated rhomboid family serine protease|uniref:Membrane associated serine protease, rhomboid family n=1 Tax=Halobellus limi TaxID=699433 RepID=A0A1H5W645_9EURY|nr:rhomboid family intramembrane serine protease [Halobellus limi]QCC46529.1 rhomboid family intramembrane serine protease [Halobellus limi]SEF94890.1 Membrane associated serine protease, rhomboid family [Halobellus limi]
MRPVSVANLMTPFANGLGSIVAQHRSLSAPVTDLLSVAVCGVYAIQAAQAVFWGVPSVFEATNYVYLRAPWLAWPLSPLLHGGLAHVVPNVITLFLFGRVAESHLPFGRFATMASAAAVGSIVALAGWSVAFGSGSNVAVYGISGVVFAAGGFALVHLPRHERVTDLELLAVLFGLCAVALVAVESFVALVSLSPANVNVGHAVGLLVGLGTAAVARDCPDSLRRDGSVSDADESPRDRDAAVPEES